MESRYVSPTISRKFVYDLSAPWDISVWKPRCQTSKTGKKKNKGQILWVLIPSPQTWSAVSTPKRHALMKHPDMWMGLLLSTAVEAPLCLPTHLSVPSTLSWFATSSRSGLGENILLWLWLRLDLMTCFDVRKPAHVPFKVTLVRQDLPLCYCFFFSFHLGYSYECSYSADVHTHKPTDTTVGRANL